MADAGVADDILLTYNVLGDAKAERLAAREEFAILVKEIAMQIAASSPSYVSRDAVPGDILEKEKSIYRGQIEQMQKETPGKPKPANVIEKIVEGRMNKFYEETVLLDQPFVKDPAKTVGELVTEKATKTGEKFKVRRFQRYKMGEGLEKKADDFSSEVASMVS